MELFAVGGYDKIGKNMTALVVGDEALILDMGIDIESLMTQDYDVQSLSNHEMRGIGALPDDSVIEHLKDKVQAIVIGHGHLDHIGGVSKLAHTYGDVPIFVTPFSAEVLRKQLFDEKRYKMNREVVSVLPSGRVTAGNFTIEFVPAAHSIPDTAILVIHTDEGRVVYANDFKFDSHPVLGHQTNVERLRELGRKGVKAAIFDTTRIARPGRTGSETDARKKIEEAFDRISDGGIIATTFASHIARLQTLIEFGHKKGKKVLILGRSMEKYIGCASAFQMLRLEKSRVYGRAPIVEKVVNEIKDKKEDYLLIVTGNQGEPNSILYRMANGTLDYPFDSSDHVLFCCEVIPTETNIALRQELENKLSEKGVQMDKDLHVSGHASREDMREFLNLLKPEHIIPTHGGRDKLKSAEALAKEEGFKDIHLLHDGESVRF